MLNKKYTIAELKRIVTESGSYYFSRDTIRFFGSKVHATYKHALFIESIDNFDGTKKIFKIKALIENSNCKIWTLVDNLNNLYEARMIVKALQNCFENKLGNREKETLENVDSIQAHENGVIRFFSSENKDNPSCSFDILWRDGEYQIVG